MTLPPVQSGHKEGTSEDDAKVRQGDTTPASERVVGHWRLGEAGVTSIFLQQRSNNQVVEGVVGGVVHSDTVTT